MKTRYDFGYQLEKGSTNEWAYDQISNNSKVLELGAAVGNLTKHLSQEKKCVVDIVEIDVESGNMAAKFARKALVGEIDGNLNTRNWYFRLQGETYDYVVILDVLEHLDNPRDVLEIIKTLLAPDGKIVLSIPNISNNAVLINLYNDIFKYTELGLLDQTHKYFMTYHSIIDMMRSLNYNIDSIDAIMKTVGTTEIVNSYADVPEEVAYALKGRRLGNVYQYLLVLGLKEKVSIDYLAQYENNDNAFQSIVLFNGISEGKSVFLNKTENVCIEFDIDTSRDISSIRFVPMEHSCIVSNLNAQVWVDNKWTQVYPNWTTGLELMEGNFVFGHDSQEMNWLLSGHEERMKIQFNCSIVYSNMQFLIEQYKYLSNLRSSETTQLKIENEKLQQEIVIKNSETTQLKIENEKLQHELFSIKDNLYYKIYIKMKTIKEKLCKRGS